MFLPPQKSRISSWHVKRDGTLALLCCNVALASGVESVEIPWTHVQCCCSLTISIGMSWKGNYPALTCAQGLLASVSMRFPCLYCCGNGLGQRVRERNTYLQYLNVCLSGSATESSIQKSISTLAAPCFLIINVLVRARHNAAAKGSL